MSIEALLKTVPAPHAAFEAFAGPWEPIEAELGTSLPQDYKDFARIYGRGYFMEFLGINIPRSKNPNTRFEVQVRRVCESFADWRDDELPYPLWPHPEGLVPFGGTDDGDSLFWLARGAPDDWRVVVWDRGMQEFEALDCGLTDFLAGLATGRVAPKEFPDDLLPCDRLFQPSQGPNGHKRTFGLRGRFGSSDLEGGGALSPVSHHGGGVAKSQLSLRFRAHLRSQT
jgi:hypothetical protein